MKSIKPILILIGIIGTTTYAQNTKKSEIMYIEEAIEIQKVIDDYFNGIFEGNTQKLRSVFHPNTVLYGDIKGQPYLKNLDDYLDGVKNRKSPKDMGEAFRMKTLGVEVLGNNAIVKLHFPMLGYNYYDFLSLSKIDGKWHIVNKLFTHISRE